MSTALEQVLKDIDELSHSERALVAHCLISSLDSKQSDDVWSDLVEAKFPELGVLAADNVMSEATEFTEPNHPSWKNKRLRKKIQGKPLSSAVLDGRGSGNYTKEKHEILDNPNVDELFDVIDNTKLR